jgi:hypothetical protein
LIITMKATIKSIKFKHLSLVFAMVVLAAVLVIIIYSSSKAVITIKTTHVTRNYTLEFTKNSQAESSQDNLNFDSWQSTLSQQAVFTVASKNIDQPARAVGRIKITNNRGTAQILIATTRFLTPDNILFRLGQTVSIPPGAQIIAPVTADQTGASGDITSGTTLSIPGLSEPLQVQVFAEAVEDFAGGIVRLGQITESDLLTARHKLAEKITEATKVEYLAQILLEKSQDIGGESIAVPDLATNYEVIKETINPALGELASDFTYSLSLLVDGLSYDKAELEQKARARTSLLLSPENRLLGITKIEPVIKPESYPETLQVTVGLETIIGADTFSGQYLLAGKNKKELTVYFAEIPELELVSVKLSPFWISRIPKNVSRVDVILVTD